MASTMQDEPVKQLALEQPESECGALEDFGLERQEPNRAAFGALIRGLGKRKSQI